MSTPQQDSPLQFAHAVFAGGGVRGIAHVGALEIAEQLGYRWDYIAGTSAGAIIAALVAAGYSAKDLHSIMQEIDYSRFAPCPAYDPLHVSEISNILTRGGLHDSSYIEEFVREKLQAKRICTFGDLLVVGQGRNPNLFQRYKLTVIASDITQGRILRLPQDTHLYGIDPNALDVARAVRMSASIPFFFVPMQLTDANGSNSCIVDGGMLSNFPLFLFARLYPYYAAKASVSVSRSNNARGISTISGCAGDIQESVTGQSCLRTNASVSANVGRVLVYQAV